MLDLVYVRDRASRRETKLLNVLLMIKSTLWKGCLSGLRLLLLTSLLRITGAVAETVAEAVEFLLNVSVRLCSIQEIWIGDTDTRYRFCFERTTRCIFTKSKKYLLHKQYPKYVSPNQIQSQNLVPIY